MSGKMVMSADVAPPAARQSQEGVGGCMPCRALRTLLHQGTTKTVRAAPHTPKMHSEGDVQMGTANCHLIDVKRVCPNMCSALGSGIGRFGPFDTPPSSPIPSERFFGVEAVYTPEGQHSDLASTGLETEEGLSQDNTPKGPWLPSLLSSRSKNKSEFATPMGSASTPYEHRTPLQKPYDFKPLLSQDHESARAFAFRSTRHASKNACPVLDLVSKQDVVDTSKLIGDWASKVGVVIAASTKTISATAIDSASEYASKAGVAAVAQTKTMSAVAADAAAEFAIKAGTAAAASTRTMSTAAADTASQFACKAGVVASASSRRMSAVAVDAASGLATTVDSVSNAYADRILEGMRGYHRNLQEQDSSDLEDEPPKVQRGVFTGQKNLAHHDMRSAPQRVAVQSVGQKLAVGRAQAQTFGQCAATPPSGFAPSAAGRLIPAPTRTPDEARRFLQARPSFAMQSAQAPFSSESTHR